MHDNMTYSEFLAEDARRDGVSDHTYFQSFHSNDSVQIYKKNVLESNLINLMKVVENCLADYYFRKGEHTIDIEDNCMLSEFFTNNRLVIRAMLTGFGKENYNLKLDLTLPQELCQDEELLLAGGSQGSIELASTNFASLIREQGSFLYAQVYSVGARPVERKRS